MANHDLPILNHSVLPDDSNEVYPCVLNNEMTLTNAKKQIGIMFEGTLTQDIGIELNFSIPQNYAGTPVLVIQGIIDGTPANVLGFAVSQLGRDASENIDTAYETEDTNSNSTWTGYVDKDPYEMTITITPASAYAVGDIVFMKFVRDNSADTATFNFILTGLFFRYSDT